MAGIPRASLAFARDFFENQENPELVEGLPVGLHYKHYYNLSEKLSQDAMVRFL